MGNRDVRTPGYTRPGRNEKYNPEAIDKVMSVLLEEFRVDGDCWRLSRGMCNPRYGYQTVQVEDRKVLVHRVSYMYHYGPIPKGFVIDHVRDAGCNFKDCINPTHLEAVTTAENNRRAAEWRRLSGIKTKRKTTKARTRKAS